MKKYERLEMTIDMFEENDVMATSNDDEFEGEIDWG